MIVVAGLAPPTADIEWQAGMTSANQEIYTAIEEKLDFTSKHLFDIAQKLIINETSHLSELWPDMSVFDRLIFELQPDLFVCTAAGHAAGTANGFLGWQQNARALRNDWAFDPNTIQTPTLILQGTDDPYVSAEHGEWLHKHMVNSELIRLEGGHFVNWLQMRKQLAYLREQHTGGDTVELHTNFRLASAFDNYV
jgi:pimeloyl-ACP methyl ester carboxylesterase